MRTFSTIEKATEYVGTLPWGTAAGTSRDPRMILKYAQAGAKIVGHGSNTWESRAGDPNNFFYCTRSGNSGNALRLPNRSLRAYIPELKQLKKDVNAAGAELAVSFSAGDTFIAREYEDAMRILFEEEAADLGEANGSCPNVKTAAGKLKPAVCYDIGAYTELVAATRAGAGKNRIIIKWAPIPDPGFQEALVEAGKPYDPDYLELANTVAGCYFEDERGNPGLASVRGGGAGAMLDPIICGMILGVKPMLDGTGTKLIATGGVRNGKTAHDRLKLGADGFRFNTELYRRDGDPAVVTDIGADLARHLVHA